MVDAKIMPLSTAVPMPRRLNMAAPVAMASGIRPAIKAKLVIITARKRACAPLIAASVPSLSFPGTQLLETEGTPSISTTRIRRDAGVPFSLFADGTREATRR